MDSGHQLLLDDRLGRERGKVDLAVISLFGMVNVAMDRSKGTWMANPLIFDSVGRLGGSVG